MCIRDRFQRGGEQDGEIGPDLSGLFDPSGYTGMSGPLVDRALERFENFRQVAFT